MDSELLKGTLSLLILTLLKRRPMYGYELVKTVREETNGALEWKEGSLYPSLHKLAKDGLVRGEWREAAGERRRRYYHVTAEGRAALAEKMASWTLLSRAVEDILATEREKKNHERA